MSLMSKSKALKVKASGKATKVTKSIFKTKQTKQSSSFKATQASAPVRIAKPNAILIDVEGTTIPIDFVTKMLNPFFSTNKRFFLWLAW